MANNGCIHVPSHCTKSFVIINAIYVWNFLQSHHLGTLLYLLRTKQLKDLIINYFLTRYV